MVLSTYHFVRLETTGTCFPEAFAFLSQKRYAIPVTLEVIKHAIRDSTRASRPA
jgi:hypothetical protein